MRDFIYTTKRNLCPICNNHHGCRIWNDGRIYCLRTTHPQDVPSGYRFVSELRGGMGAVVVPDTQANDKEYQSRQAQAEREIQKQHQQNLDSLSIEERDKAIRRMHFHLGLSSSDRAYLREVRGLTDEQIELGLYFTVNPYQDLPSFIPVNFPGVSYTGKTLSNKHRAIACVTFNSQGLATGIQLRLTGEVEGGRYRWLSGQHKAHLPSGELPLTYITPKVIKRPGVAFVEGTGFKPQIAAEKLGQIVIGAAGGQHASSPQQLKEFLSEGRRQMAEGRREEKGEGEETFPPPNGGAIQIYLDAGDINNNHVMNRLINLISLLKSWGHEIKIAWWGQTTKEHDDIDELSDYSLIQYIPLEKFQPLVEFRKILLQKDEINYEIKSPDFDYEKQIAREKEEEEIQKAQSEYNKFFESLQKVTSWINTQARQAKIQEEKLSKTIGFKTIGEDTWVKFDEIKASLYSGHRFIEYEEGQFYEIVNWLLCNKVRVPIETTETGGGKTFKVANAKITDFALFWQSELMAKQKADLLESLASKNNNQSGENPEIISISPKISYFSSTGIGTVEKLNERYARIPVRNVSTCHLIDSQHKLNELNYDYTSGNPVCQSCKYWIQPGKRDENTLGVEIVYKTLSMVIF